MKILSGSFAILLQICKVCDENFRLKKIVKKNSTLRDRESNHIIRSSVELFSITFFFSYVNFSDKITDIKSIQGYSKAFQTTRNKVPGFGA
jgi:hypothetical protein